FPNSAAPLLTRCIYGLILETWTPLLSRLHLHLIFGILTIWKRQVSVLTEERSLPKERFVCAMHRSIVLRSSSVHCKVLLKLIFQDWDSPSNCAKIALLLAM